MPTRRRFARIRVFGKRKPKTGGHVPFEKSIKHYTQSVFALVLKLPYRDLSSGFRLYHKPGLDRIQLGSSGYEILEEIIVRFHINAWAIRETPFHYYARKSGKSHVKFFIFGVAYLKALLRMWKIRYSTSPADCKAQRKRAHNCYPSEAVSQSRLTAVGNSQVNELIKKNGRPEAAGHQDGVLDPPEIKPNSAESDMA